MELLTGILSSCTGRQKRKSLISIPFVWWSKMQKKEKDNFIFVLLMIYLNKFSLLLGHNYWKKIKKSDYQKCNHACIMHALTAIIYTNINQYVNYVYLPHL
jgi:hypothetical protein